MDNFVCRQKDWKMVGFCFALLMWLGAVLRALAHARARERARARARAPARARARTHARARRFWPIREGSGRRFVSRLRAAKVQSLVDITEVVNEGGNHRVEAVFIVVGWRRTLT